MARPLSRQRNRAFPAKLTALTLPIVLERPRLYRRLDQARKKPVIWIAGPPGAGKTTLAAGYLRTRHLRPLWYNLDERDSDPATFFHYLGLAVQHAAPRFRHPLPHLTPEFALGLPVFTRNFFEGLYSRLKLPAVLVFDNYHHIMPDSQLHEMLQVGFSEIPSGVTVILLSRQAPPPAFSALEAAQRVEVIEPEALKLTEREFDGIVHLHAKRSQRKFDQTLRHDVHRRINGWVAGLILVLEQIKADKGEVVFEGDKQPEVLFEYLASQSLAGISHDTHTFLLKTCHLPAMTATMAEQITGMSSASEILSRLYRARYFTERRTETETWYQYHPLFRDFLLVRAKSLFSDMDRKSLQSSAAAMLADAGRIEEAMQIWRETGETDRSVMLILSQAPSLVAQGRTQTLEEWLSGLPPETLETHPWLLYWQAVAKILVNPRDSRNIFERAYEGLKRNNDSIGVLMAWCGVRDASFFSGGEAIDVEARLAEIQNLLPEEGAFPVVEMEFRVASTLLCLLVWQRPQHPLITVWQRRVLPRLADLPDLILMGRIGLDMVQHAVWIADYTLAKDMLTLLREHIASDSAPPFARLHFMLADIMLSYPQGEPLQILAKVNAAMQLAESSGIHILTPWIAGQLILARLLMFDLEGAQSWLDKLRPSMEHRPDNFGGFYHYMAAKLCCYRGERQDALRHAEMAVNFCSRAGALYCEALSRLGLSKLLYDMGKDQEAQAHLGWVFQVAREINGKLLECVGNFISAEVAFSRGDEPRGIDALRRGLNIGAAGGSTYPMWFDAPSWTRLCCKALNADIQPMYVKKLIRIMNLVPGRPTHEYETWPWPVMIKTFGPFTLQIDGKPLPTSRKTPRRLLEVLKAIVAFGGNNVPVSRILDVLWPDAEGDAAYRALISAVARLRKILGRVETIVFQDSRLTLNTAMVWVDSAAFDMLALESSREVETAGDRRQFFDQATRMYRGSFLAEETDLAWVEPPRERLRAKYVRLIETAVQSARACSDWDQAVAYAEHAIETEPLSEPLYRLLMTTLRHAGRTVAAQDAYVRCCKALHQSGYGSPSQETLRVYKDIRSS